MVSWTFKVNKTWPKPPKLFTPYKYKLQNVTITNLLIFSVIKISNHFIKIKKQRNKFTTYKLWTIYCFMFTYDVNMCRSMYVYKVYYYLFCHLHFNSSFCINVHICSRYEFSAAFWYSLFSDIFDCLELCWNPVI